MFRTWNRKLVLLLAAGVAVYAFAVMKVADAKKVGPASQDVWTANTENRNSIIKYKAVGRQSFPTEFKLFNLNFEPLRQQLLSVVDSGARRASTVITLPNAAGNLEEFEVFEASNFEPDLQAQYPQIRAYSGRGITDHYATLKLSLSPQGIQTMVFRTDVENEFMEPYSQDHTTYAVFRSSRQRGSLPWECSTEDRNMMSDAQAKAAQMAQPESNTGEVRTVRLAQSNNGEYAGYFMATTACNGDDKTRVLTAFNNTLTRVNGVNEKDIALHMNLIAATTNVIYCDPATDPYTTLSNWNTQLQNTLTANIGEANYDIGHMFGASGGGGNAGCIGCVCSDGTKGRGITSPADAIPEGDNFDIDYVVHEMGHQLGGNHSFTFSNEGTVAQKEVGSGITIMGYAGITSVDVAPHSIDTFHAANIGQIQSNLATKACPITTVMTANHPPVVTPGANYTIPISTPFALTGAATDPEADPLTYQWEQMDTPSTFSNAFSVASPTKANGPNFLSFPPTASPTRSFPRLSTVQAGLFVTPTLPGGDAVANIEALSSIARTLSFRLTVRDNHAYVAGSTTGQTQFTDSVVTVSATAGPFKVTAPNTGVSWNALASQTVTWDVASTTGGGVNTANVKISLSTDGGNTFPIVLSASTPNDGSESVTIPNNQSTTARIKVEAVGNIFYDMSDVNFTIAAPARPVFDFDGDSRSDYVVARNAAGTINWYLQRSTAGFGIQSWGSTGDSFVPGDYDGDGKWDFGIWRAGSFYILQSSTNTLRGVLWGLAGDDPRVTQDFDGDAKADPAVTRNVGGTLTYYILRSTAGYTSVAFGDATTDVPIRGDFDGDGKADVASYRTTGDVINQFRVLRSTDGLTQTHGFGLPGVDYVVSGDFDGDQKTDFAVWRGKTGAGDGGWYWVRSTTGAINSVGFGVAGVDLPVPGDYDGDGKADPAIWRSGASGTFYTLGSTSGFSAFSFGTTGDVEPAFTLQVR